jgi:hypothetical protein
MHFDKTIVSLGLKNVYGPTMNPTVLVENLKQQQDTFRVQENMADVFIVFEDCTNTPNAWTILTDLGYTGRHYGLHSAAVSHKLTSIPRGNRTQIQQWFLFKPHEESEREWILYMFSRLPTRHIWQQAITRAWDIPYNFLYIDFERKEMQDVYRSGLNDSLFTPEEIGMLNDIEHGLYTMSNRTGQIYKRPSAEVSDPDLPPPTSRKRATVIERPLCKSTPRRGLEHDPESLPQRSSNKKRKANKR